LAVLPLIDTGAISMLFRNYLTLGSQTRFAILQRGPCDMRFFVSKPAFATGFTLVELMVGIVVGLIVIGGAIAVFVTTLVGSTNTIREARLNQEMRVAMDFMVEDIRRAGFWSGAAGIDFGSSAMANHPNEFASRDPTTDRGVRDFHILEDGRCILFSFEPTFAANDQEVFGYRQNGTVLQMLHDPDGSVETTEDCTAGGWVALTSPAVLVQQLSFNTTGSRCFNVTAPDNPEWAVTDPAFREPACLDQEATDFVAPNDGDILVESRNINILLEGRHRDSNTSLLRLTETVHIRNNLAFRFEEAH
jgi:prepilin peptidase dependent protein B